MMMPCDGICYVLIMFSRLLFFFVAWFLSSTRFVNKSPYFSFLRSNIVISEIFSCFCEIKEFDLKNSLFFENNISVFKIVFTDLFLFLRLHNLILKTNMTTVLFKQNKKTHSFYYCSRMEWNVIQTIIIWSWRYRRGIVKAS